MEKIRYEIWHDAESRRLWGLELFDHEIIGCVGPLRDDAAFPPRLADVAFERNADLMRWIRRKRRQATSSTGPDAPLSTLQHSSPD